MHNGGWEALLRHIPEEQHNKFMLVTASGTEIAVQNFLRVEKELLIVKGRLSGSQDQGRIFFIPYAHIDYFGTSQVTKETEFSELFDSLTFPVAAQVSNGVAASPEPDAAVSEPEPVPRGRPDSVFRSPPPPQSPSGVRQAIRSQVLEKFRNARSSSPSSSSNLPRPPES